MTTTYLATIDDVGDGIPSGTSFPGSPSTNDVFRRMDRGLIYYYDGTRWLTLQEYPIELKREDSAITWPPTANTTPVHRGVPPKSGFDVWLTTWESLSSVQTTNNGTNFWTHSLWKYNSAGGGDTQIGSYTTAADTAGNAYQKSVAINALLGSFVGLYTVANKTLSPGASRFHGGTLWCRLVG